MKRRSEKLPDFCWMDVKETNFEQVWNDDTLSNWSILMIMYHEGPKWRESGSQEQKLVIIIHYILRCLKTALKYWKVVKSVGYLRQKSA